MPLRELVGQASRVAPLQGPADALEQRLALGAEPPLLGAELEGWGVHRVTPTEQGEKREEGKHRRRKMAERWNALLAYP